MTHLYRNKYRIASARLPSWDYGWNAAYFVTICTKDRVCYFGNVEDEAMQWSQIGRIAKECWLEIPGRFPYARLENHIVMPNHVHGIVVIDKPEGGDGDTIGGDGMGDAMGDGDAIRGGDGDVMGDGGDVMGDGRDAMGDGRDAINRVSTGGITGNHNPMLHDNLSRIIRWYKGRVTFECRKIHPSIDLPEFAWQSRFYDHIIRDDKSFRTICDYIDNNPAHWQEDKFFHP